MIDGIVVIVVSCTVKKIRINVRYYTTVVDIIDFNDFIIEKNEKDLCAVYIRNSNIHGVFFVYFYLIRGPPLINSN